MVLYYIFIFFIITISAVIYLLSKDHDYWKKRNVPYLKPSLLFGNYKETILLQKHQAQVAKDICLMFPNEPYIGTFFGTAPALLIQDPDLMKLILVTDFYYFSGREVNDFSQNEAITKNIFFSGGNRWKIQRQNLTAIYSLTKIKGMFPIIQKCANQLECLLDDETKSLPYLDAKILFAKYTIDIITSSTFGINSNTMEKSGGETENPFIVLADKIIDSSKAQGVKLYFRQMWPWLFYRLGLEIFDKTLYRYFQKILTGIIKSRENSESSRNDFVDLLLTWKRNKVLTGDSLSNLKTGDKKTITVDIDDEFLISQCVALFGAGFEPTSTALSLALYEIAKNDDVQKKVMDEVDSYFKKNTTIEYECINELPYITACIDETMRMYPALGLITREVMHDYTLPTGLHLQKGDRIHLPIYRVHHNPDFFPEPELFRPERFYGDAKDEIRPFTFLPFNEGPRICLGLRFAKMPLVAGFLTIFKKYRVQLAEGMPLKIPFTTYSLVTASAIPIELKFVPRNA